MAIIIVSLLIMGFTMIEMDRSPLMGKLYMMHKSFGMLILLLVGFRILWKHRTSKPAPLPNHRPWERTLSALTHILLYIGMIGMPLSGWIMSSAGEYPIQFFGLFEIPAFVSKNETLFNNSLLAHELTSYMLLCAIGLHFLGAAKHHFIDQDTTFARMGTKNRVLSTIIIIALGGTLAAPTFMASKKIINAITKEKIHEHKEQLQPDHDKHTDNATNTLSPDLWTIDLDKSTIQFTATQYGQDFTGTFAKFSGTIIFNPNTLNKSTATIMIDTTSIATGSSDRDAQTQDTDWFNTANNDNATAKFESTSFEKTDSNHYIAKGHLTLRGTRLPLNFPFSLEFSSGDNGDKTANMQADFTLNRLDFKIGQGQWKATDIIGNKIKIHLDLTALSPKK